MMTYIIQNSNSVATALNIASLIWKPFYVGTIDYNSFFCDTSKSNGGQIAYKYNLPPTINTLNYEMCRYIMILIPHQQSLVPPSHAIRTPTFDDKQHGGGYTQYIYQDKKLLVPVACFHKLV